MNYQCNNCKQIFPVEDCPIAKDLEARLDSDGVYTDRECPKCGALCYSMPAVKLRYTVLGAHTHVDVFMGKDAGHLAKCGELTLREGEFQILRKSLKLGSEQEEEAFEFIEEER